MEKLKEVRLFTYRGYEYSIRLAGNGCFKANVLPPEELSCGHKYFSLFCGPRWALYRAHRWAQRLIERRLRAKQALHKIAPEEK